MNTPKVSVIIPNYNYDKYISKAIDSVLAQTYTNIEIIVVDDGSIDNSLSVLEKYGDQITVLKQQNQGVSPARNAGVAHSSGEYLAFLDADDIWLPEKLERQMERFLGSPEVGLVHCSMTFIDGDGNPSGNATNGIEGRVAEKILLFEGVGIIGAGSTGLVSRKAFDEVGGFDPMQTTAADWDFSYQVATKYEIAFVPDELVLYRKHGSNMHGNIRAMEHDMMLGYEKAFAAPTTVDRRTCYGNLHKTLAGSYFYAGQYGAFARHAALSIWNRPSKIGYFAGFPLRRMRRN
ncbi:MAG TPA: glycosyltransferase [Pyrinomonadaceae bacterium]|nr:glycosyltransferase [Pyrinomonadaceae bacterium]